MSLEDQLTTRTTHKYLMLRLALFKYMAHRMLRMLTN